METSRPDERPDVPDTGNGTQTLDVAWQDLCNNLLAASDIIKKEDVAKDPTLRAAGYRYLLNLLNANPDSPEIGRHQDHTRRYSNESADCLFGHAALDPNGMYRLTGSGGSAHFTGLTLYGDMDLYNHLKRAPNSDFKAIFAAATVSTVAAMSHPGSLSQEDNGDFEVILSAEPQDGNWLPMTPQVRSIVTRQYFYDWDREEPHHISVERLDPPEDGPTIEAATVSEQLEDVGRFVKFADLPSELPESVRRVSPHQRRETLDRRRRAVLRRYGP